MFERDIFDKIQEIWFSEQFRCDYPGEKPKEPPAIDTLRAVIEAAFLASLKREEGRPVDFSIALVSQEEIQESHRVDIFGGMQQVMSFPAPLPLRVEIISKLAAAIDKRTTALAVEPVKGKSNAEFQIWGFLYFGPSQDRFDEVNLSGPRLSTLRPDCLIITTASAGSLTIARGYNLLGYFESGRLTRSTGSPLTQDLMQHHIESAIKENIPPDLNAGLYSLIYRDSIKRLLTEASRRGDGGTVILIPPADAAKTTGLYRPIYSFDGDLGIGHLLEKMVIAEMDHSPHYDPIKRLLALRLAALSQFSCIDGALLITANWHMIAFGAKLAATKWTGQVLIGPGAIGGGGTFDTSKLGTRHNSAIDFVGACSSAIGFVLSEDGPIRGLIKRDEQTILCWPDCRSSIFD
ncbi:putative sensor domain DACNV-containing protein [Archangium gephyra]|uniref:putative sensor domain DACNV-containing protein n=1 Tax=Archangium gephyra TaxID=48 RepID=UPI0012E2EA67|nr:hypothetical protein [Archangium gephyra]